jgi:hypothetical protein
MKQKPGTIKVKVTENSNPPAIDALIKFVMDRKNGSCGHLGVRFVKLPIQKDFIKLGLDVANVQTIYACPDCEVAYINLYNAAIAK